MRVIVTSNYSETGEVAGGMIAKVVQDKPTATLGLATGSSPEVVYANLIRAYEAGEVDFSKVHTVIWMSTWAWLRTIPRATGTL